MAILKKVNKKNLGTSFDRLLSYNLHDDGTIDDQMIELADAILSDCPVLQEEVPEFFHVLLPPLFSRGKES